MSDLIDLRWIKRLIYLWNDCAGLIIAEIKCLLLYTHFPCFCLCEALQVVLCWSYVFITSEVITLIYINFLKLASVVRPWDNLKSGLCHISVLSDLHEENLLFAAQKEGGPHNVTVWTPTSHNVWNTRTHFPIQVLCPHPEILLGQTEKEWQTHTHLSNAAVLASCTDLSSLLVCVGQQTLETWQGSFSLHLSCDRNVRKCRPCSDALIWRYVVPGVTFLSLCHFTMHNSSSPGLCHRPAVWKQSNTDWYPCLRSAEALSDVFLNYTAGTERIPCWPCSNDNKTTLIT